MSRRIKILIGCIVLFMCIAVTTGIVVYLLHGRNSAVVDIETTVEETTTSVAVIETVEESTELFSSNLSDHVGEVIISTYVSEDMRDVAVSTANTLERDNLALYVFSVSYDKSTGEQYLSYNAYNKDTGEFYGDDISLVEGEADYTHVVYESYQGQVTVIK